MQQPRVRLRRRPYHEHARIKFIGREDVGRRRQIDVQPKQVVDVRSNDSIHIDINKEVVVVVQGPDLQFSVARVGPALVGLVRS